MNPSDNPYAPPAIAVSHEDATTRSEFISKTYNHLFGAVFAFVGFELLLFKSGIADQYGPMLAKNFMFVFGAFMVCGWLFSSMAAKAVSKPAQYAALAAYVIAEGLIFLPMLWMANTYAPGAIASAGWITLAGFVALTAIAWTSKADFTFLGSFLKWIGVVAVLAIVGSFAFGWHLGTWFSVAMIAFAGAAILYETSNIMHNYPKDRYISASLGLFASVAMMFWYVLRLVMSFSSD